MVLAFDGETREIDFVNGLKICLHKYHERRMGRKEKDKLDISRDRGIHIV